VIEGVTERTGGVPLFIEEITRLLLERGEHATLQAIPPTLQQSLTARLDRLGSAREVAQIGAVIGRDFSYALLRAVAGAEDAPLQRALDRLAEADILLVQGVLPDADYRFKHALIQDAAYENLLKSRRQTLHRRVGEVLLNQFAAIATTGPELLAHHFAQAGLTEAAIEWWSKAGQRSLERSALVEAVEQISRALDQIATLPSAPALRREQIKLQATLANALMHTQGYAATRTREALKQARSLIERAEALGEAPEDPLLLFSVLYGFWVGSYITFNGNNGNTLCDLAAQFLTLAKKQGSRSATMVGHCLVGTSLLFVGDPAKGRTHLDRALALYDPTQDGLLATRFGQDLRVVILSYRSLALWSLGYPKAAMVDSDQALRYARESCHAVTLIYALWHAALAQTVCKNYATASALLEEASALAEEKRAVFWKANATVLRGWVFAETGNASKAIQVTTTVMAAMRTTGATSMFPNWFACQASAYAELGRYNEAWRRISQAIAMIQATEEKRWEAEINRIAGEIALKSPEHAIGKTELYFERALAIAKQQQAKSWEVRAAMSMARLWRDQGKRDEARDLLAPVYGWFTEGFDTLDLKEAKALLDELDA
jgi:predicted ATPase